MSSPNDTFHDTSEQTPLLVDTTAGQAQPEQVAHRSFLPSILPWRGLAHGRGYHPPKPPSTPTRPELDQQDPPPASDGETSGNSDDPSDPNDPEGPNRSNNNESETGPADGPSDDNNDNGQSSTRAADGTPITGPWGDPAGLDKRRANDENVLLFREAIGIPTSSTRPTSPASELCHPPHHDPESGGPSLDQSRKHATGIYARILQEKKAKMWQASLLNGLLNTCHVAQILVGAVLTTLGPSAQDHAVAITVLGATNTVLAGVFMLMKGQGLPDRLRKEALAFRRVQDWVEETDALLVAGVVGRDRREVGLLVETAFQKYNAVVANEQSSSWPDPTKQLPEAASGVAHAEASGVSSGGGTRGMAPVPVPVPVPVPAVAAQEDLLVDVGTPGGDGGSSKSGPDVQAASLASLQGSEDLNQDGNTNGPSSMPGVRPVD